MAAPKVKIARVKDDTVNRNLDSIKATLDNLTAQPQPVAITGVGLATGLNTVAHGLNKTLTGWQLTDISAQATIWSSQSNPSIATLPNIYLYLNASAPCTVNLEVW